MIRDTPNTVAVFFIKYDTPYVIPYVIPRLI